MICRREPISSCCPAASAMAIICAAAPSPARAHVMDAVRGHAARGGLVLGICNGFQILCESGLLPGVLMRNRDLRFICKHAAFAGRAQRHRLHPPTASIKRSTSPSPMARAITRADDETIRAARRRRPRRLPLLRRHGKRRRRANPNGSTNDIAGIYSEKIQCARHDAASGKSDRSAGRRH